MWSHVALDPIWSYLLYYDSILTWWSPTVVCSSSASLRAEWEPISCLLHITRNRSLQVCPLSSQVCPFSSKVCPFLHRSVLFCTMVSLSSQVCNFSSQVCLFSSQVCLFSSQVCPLFPQVCPFSSQVCPYSLQFVTVCPLSSRVHQIKCNPSDSPLLLF